MIGDIPPLAHAAAARAGVPAIAIGNFTWDWIYAGYASFAREAPGVIPVIRDAYALATRALRLPLHGGFEPMAAVTVDIPFIARRSMRNRADTRRALSVPDDRPFVVASFGAYGSTAAYDDIARAQRLTVLSPGSTLPAGLAYQDVVAAADLVITKPGYGIVSECVANDTPLLYTSRGRFVEYDVFVAEMPRVLRCRFIPQDDLMAGRWRTHVDALLAQPPPPDARGSTALMSPRADLAILNVALTLRRCTSHWCYDSLTQVTSDQIRGTFTFSIETGRRSACARNAGRSRSDLKPTCTVNGEMPRSIQASAGFALRK